jgi:hypothetical protein
MSSSAENKKFWRNQIRHRAIMALGGKCVCCGQKFEECCYDLHHLDPTEKEFTIGRSNINGAKSWLRLRDEIKKCVLVCSNCHRLIHSGYIAVEVKNYFDDSYYEWDLCNYKQINHNTGEPLDVNHICPKCGNYKTGCADFCRKCSPYHQEIFDVDKETLKEMIFTMSMTKIGEYFGVSDNAIRKRCKKLGLPYLKSEISKYTEFEWKNI